MSWNNIIPVEYYMEESLVERLRKRAEIRRQITSRKSVQEGQPDRLSDLLEEAANKIDELAQAPVSATGVALAEPAPRLPDGWFVTVSGDILGTVTIEAPNGYSAVTTSVSRNPENVLRMLVADLMRRPPAQPTEPTRSQKMRDAGYTRRPSAKSLPSDSMDEPEPSAVPKVPEGYTEEELERDNPYNQYMYDN